MIRSHSTYLSKGLSILMLSSFAFVFSCKKGEVLPNAAPDTKISLEEINLTGDSRVHSCLI